jgi:hypothetical protein
MAAVNQATSGSNQVTDMVTVWRCLQDLREAARQLTLSPIATDVLAFTTDNVPLMWFYACSGTPADRVKLSELVEVYNNLGLVSGEARINGYLSPSERRKLAEKAKAKAEVEKAEKEREAEEAEKERKTEEAKNAAREKTEKAEKERKSKAEAEETENAAGDPERTEAGEEDPKLLRRATRSQAKTATPRKIMEDTEEASALAKTKKDDEEDDEGDAGGDADEDEGDEGDEGGDDDRDKKDKPKRNANPNSKAHA